MSRLQNRQIKQPPSLAELPPPPAGKSDWPWTKQSQPLPPTLPNGSPWPAITIVTASYNQSPFLEETIRSVLLQGYPNLEYIIIDGGSSDSSLEIIRRYEKWLAFWVSEPDRGQADALNKGFARATGEIAAWLNSDDVYLPNALEHVARSFGVDPARAVVYGHCNIIDEQGRFLSLAKSSKNITFNTLIKYWRTSLSQPAVFFRRRLLGEVGWLNIELRYVMDYDLWLRVAQKYPFYPMTQTLVNFRMHQSSKTTQNWPLAFYAECEQVNRPYLAIMPGWRRMYLSIDQFVGRLQKIFRARTRLRAFLKRVQSASASGSRKNQTRIGGI
jgi:glycosyltransferase involved in cell wall biosynthesis